MYVVNPEEIELALPSLPLVILRTNREEPNVEKGRRRGWRAGDNCGWNSGCTLEDRRTMSVRRDKYQGSILSNWRVSWDHYLGDLLKFNRFRRT
jgi:hypothetical protein